MSPLFVDASSAILLEKAGLFSLVAKTCRIVITDEVIQELTRADYPDSAIFHQLAINKVIHIESIKDTIDLSNYPEIQYLDKGEMTTLCLYLQEPEGFIIIDDKKAAQVCRKYKFHFINALLVPKIFLYAGYLNSDDYHTYTTRLLNAGRYSQKVKTIAAELSRTDLKGFIDQIKP